MNANTDKIYANFDKVQGAVDAINASLKLTSGIIITATGSAMGLAAAFGKAADAAGRMQAAANGMGGGGSGGADSGGSGGGDSGPVYLPGGGSSNLPAVIPGQGPYGYGPQSWGHTPFPGYGTGGTPSGPDSDPNGYQPNWTPGSTPDASFDNSAPTLYPNGKPGGGNFVDSYFYAMMAKGIAEDLISKPFDDAATVDQKLAILQANGMSAAEAQQAYNTAFKMQEQKQYSTLSVDTLLGILSASFLQTRDAGEAEGILPQLANAATILQGIGNSGIQSQMFDLLRSGDLAGLLNDTGKDGKPDLTRLNKFVQTFTDIEMATGDAVSPAQMVHLFQNLGPASLSIDSQGLGLTMLMALSLGQQKAGTGINQMFKELIGGKMSIPTEKFLIKQGLLNGKEVSRSGDYVQMAPDALVDQSAFISDPVSWFAQHIGGAMQGDTPDQRAELIHDIYASASTAQGSRAVADAIFQNKLLMRYLTGASQLAPLDVLALGMSNTPTGTAKAAGAAGNALIVTLSNDTMSMFMPMLNFYTGAANMATKAALTHPEAAGDAELFAGLMAIWGTLKGASKVNFLGGGKGFGLAGDVAGKFLGPGLFYGEAFYDSIKSLYDDDISGTGATPAPWTAQGQKIEAQSSANRDKLIQAIEKQTSQLIAVLKGNGGTGMPTKQTSVNTSKTMPMPGQPLTNQ